MLPYLIAGAIGFVVAKIFNEDEAPKYANGGYIKNIKKLYEEDGSDVYGGDFGEQGGLNWRINKEEDYLYLMGIGRNNNGSNEGESKGEGSRAIAYLFFLYPKLNVIYFEIEGEEGAWQFYKKIGAEEEGGGEITEDTYNAQITRKSFRKYFKNKDISFSFNNGGSVLIAPNGKPSNLTPEQYKLVRTPAFKEWFGDWENDPTNASKVVDSNGEPLVVYHGTNYKFNTFDKNKLGISQGTSPANMYGFYFSNNKIVGKSFGKHFKECFIKIKNPKTIDLKRKDYSQSKYIVNDFVEKINMKYDGGILFNYKDSGGNKIIIANQYIVPNSNQIKLADGSNDTFDGNNPDIRYAGGGLTYSEVETRVDNFLQWFENNGWKELSQEEVIKAGLGNVDDYFWIEGYTFQSPDKNVLLQFSRQARYILDKYGVFQKIYSRYRDKEPIIMLDTLLVKEKGKGQGTKAIKLITELADKFGVIIHLYSKPLPKMEYLNDKKLFDFYKKAGFEVLKENKTQKIMVYNPNQIKLTDGTNTTFDGNNPDIRFKRGGRTL